MPNSVDGKFLKSEQWDGMEKLIKWNKMRKLSNERFVQNF
jgi:hypothetical protein